MSIWSYRQKNQVEEQSDLISDVDADYPTKAINRIDLTSKLQVILALDNGRCNADVAKEYGVHLETIAYIYKHRDSIVNKNTDKFKLLQQVCNLNVEQHLLSWFEQQSTIANIVTEIELRNKALELLKPISEEFTHIDDWLFSFLMRHNISKHIPGDVHNEKSKEEWKRFISSSDYKDVYVGGFCALAYNLDLGGYLNGRDVDNYVSLLFFVNILGTDKRELGVVGKETLESETNIKSLPVSYYCCVNSQINYSIMNGHLVKWDSELSSKGKYITLILNIPDDYLTNERFNNIRIVNTTGLDYVKLILDKIEESLKYHYRRIQICKGISNGKDNCNPSDYLHMIGNAWYNVPYKYIQSLCLPAEEGTLYFNNKDDNEYEHSLSQWCKTYNIPLGIDHCQNLLDKYIFCDKELPCIYYGQVDENMEGVELLNQREPQPTSGIEGYQAMKRLVSYLQSEAAGESIMKYAKYLENHLEYGALLQMHQIISSTNDSS